MNLDLNTVTLDSDGHLDARTLEQLQRFTAAQAPAPGAPPVKLRLQITERTRSMPQHRLYFACLGEIARYQVDAGNHATTAALHILCKRDLLPLAAARTLAETGEAVDYETVHDLGDGTHAVTRSTKRLSVPAFTRLIDAVVELADGIGCDLSPFLSEMDVELDGSVRIGGQKLRTGAIVEDSAVETLVMEARDAPAIDMGPGPVLNPDADGLEGQLAALFDTTGGG